MGPPGPPTGSRTTRWRIDDLLPAGNGQEAWLYQYDGASRKTSEQHHGAVANGTTWTNTWFDFTYDSAGRLSGLASGNGVQTTAQVIAHDSNGNRQNYTNPNPGSAAISYTYNADNSVATASAGGTR